MNTQKPHYDETHAKSQAGRGAKTNVYTQSSNNIKTTRPHQIKPHLESWSGHGRPSYWGLRDSQNTREARTKQTNIEKIQIDRRSQAAPGQVPGARPEPADHAPLDRGNHGVGARRLQAVTDGCSSQTKSLRTVAAIALQSLQRHFVVFVFQLWGLLFQRGNEQPLQISYERLENLQRHRLFVYFNGEHEPRPQGFPAGIVRGRASPRPYFRLDTRGNYPM